MKTVIDDDLDTILDAGPDEYELAYRKKLFEDLFGPNEKLKERAIKILYKDYGLTYIKLKEKEFNIREAYELLYNNGRTA